MHIATQEEFLQTAAERSRLSLGGGGVATRGHFGVGHWITGYRGTKSNQSLRLLPRLFVIQALFPGRFLQGLLLLGNRSISRKLVADSFLPCPRLRFRIR